MPEKSKGTKGLIKVRCPNPACRKVLGVKVELAGKKGRCPLCGQTMTVPQLPKGRPQRRAVTGVMQREGATAGADAATAAPAAGEPGVPPTPAEAPPRGEGVQPPPPQAPQEAAAEVGAPPGPKGRLTPRRLARVEAETSDLYYEIRGGTLRVAGPLSYELDTKFRDRCEALLDSEETELVVDLSRVPYVSSSYLGVIAPLLLRAQEEGKALSIRASNKVARVLRLAGLERLGRIEIVEGEV